MDKPTQNLVPFQHTSLNLAQLEKFFTTVPHNFTKAMTDGIVLRLAGNTPEAIAAHDKTCEELAYRDDFETHLRLYLGERITQEQLVTEITDFLAYDEELARQRIAEVIASIGQLIHHHEWYELLARFNALRALLQNTFQLKSI